MLVKPNSQTTHSLCLWSWRGLRKHILDYFLKFVVHSLSILLDEILFLLSFLIPDSALQTTCSTAFMVSWWMHFCLISLKRKKTIRKGLSHGPMNTSPPLPLPSLLFLWIDFTIITPETNPFPTYILFSISFLYLKTLFCKCPQLFWIKKFSLLDYSHNNITCCSRSEPKPEEISRSLSMRKT